MADIANVKDRILKFISTMKIKKSEFERISGLSNGYLNNFKGRLGEEKLNNILTAFPELNGVWLLTGEGDMMKNGNGQQIGINNGMANQISGNNNTVTHNGSKDQVIEEQKAEIDKMFEAIIVAVNGFQKASERHDDYVVRQDDYIKRQDEYIARIINNSYQRNKENMERFDLQLSQQNELIRMVVEQSQRTQDRADQILKILEKKI